MGQQFFDGESTWSAFAGAGFGVRVGVSVPGADLHDALDLLSRGDLVAVRALAVEGQASVGEEASEVGGAGNDDSDVGGGGVAEAMELHGRDIDHLAGDREAPVEPGGGFDRELGCTFEDEEGFLVGMTVRRNHDPGGNGRLEDAILVIGFGIAELTLQLDAEEFYLLGFVHRVVHFLLLFCLVLCSRNLLRCFEERLEGPDDRLCCLCAGEQTAVAK